MKQVHVQTFQRSGSPEYPAEAFCFMLLGADGVQAFGGEGQGGAPSGVLIHGGLSKKARQFLPQYFGLRRIFGFRSGSLDGAGVRNQAVQNAKHLALHIFGGIPP